MVFYLFLNIVFCFRSALYGLCILSFDAVKEFTDYVLPHFKALSMYKASHSSVSEIGFDKLIKIIIRLSLG